MATSGSKSITVTKWDTLRFSWSVSSQSISNNTSTVAWILQLITTGYGRIDSTKSKAYTITVNGISYTGTNKIGVENNSTKTLARGSTVITHNIDGSKTFSYSFKQEFNITFSGTLIEYKSGSGTGTLDNIPRAASITTAPNFTDEDNPTITYSNPAGTAVNSLQACISLDGSKADIAYRDISKTGTSYTFNLTEAERAVLINATTTANSRKVRFYIQTVLGENTLTNNEEKTFTVINAEPTIEPTAIDNDSISKVLTGNPEGTIIKGYNSMTVAANATAYKNATIISYKISNGGKVISTASGELNGVETGQFIFTATDSRGNIVSKTLNKTLINYIKPTCNMNVAAPTTDGVVSISINGNYYNGSFGAVQNTLHVCVRYKANSGDYVDWIEGTATISNNTYNTTINISGLDYRSTYTFEAMAADAIYNGDTEPFIYSASRTVKTTPIFDWGENDFNFNVPVNVNGDLTINNSSIMATIFDLVYPVGKIIYTSKADNPATYLGGGTWEQIKDTFLLAAGDTYAAGTTGGEASHALTKAELPDHIHHAYSYSNGQNDWSLLTVKRAGVSRVQISTSSSSGRYAVVTDAGKGASYIEWPYTTKVDEPELQGLSHNNMPPYKVVYIWERTA